MLNVKVILGSTRPNRFSEKVLPWLHQTLDAQKNMQVEVLDLRDFDLPFFNSPMSPAFMEGTDYGDSKINAWSAKIQEADAFIVIAPEYNHGYTAVLKNALDVVYKEWGNKAIGFIGYGSVGGARAVEQLRQVAVELHMASTRSAVHIPMPWLLMDEKGALKDGALDPFTQPLTDMLTQLNWWGDALQAARQKGS